MSSRTSRFLGRVLVVAACITAMLAVPAFASGGNSKPIPLGEYSWAGHGNNSERTALVTVAKTGRSAYLAYGYLTIGCKLDSGLTRRPSAIRNGRFVVHAEHFIGRGTDRITGKFLTGRRVRLSGKCGQVTARYSGQDSPGSGA
jgi:hypothetical protein